MEFKESEHLAIGLASFMGQYFHIASKVLDKSIKQGNKWMVVSDTEIDWQKYENKTEWSDFRVLIPILFMTYHGFELSMKAILAINGENVRGHKLSTLYLKIKKQKDLSKEALLILGKYTTKKQMPELISKLLLANNKTVDDYYDLFKYPFSKDQKLNDYWPVKYKGKNSIPVFKEIKKDILKLSKETQNYINNKLPGPYLIYRGMSKAKAPAPVTRRERQMMKRRR